MSEKHILKLTTTEAVIKCYETGASGGNVDISFANDLTAPGQTFVNTNAKVTIAEIYWGLKVGKQLDVSRLANTVTGQTEGHYYLVNAGSYKFQGFVDDAYENLDLRLIFDGPGHCIIKLRKTSGWV